VRRFSLDPATSRFQTVPGNPMFGFQGYLDLQMEAVNGSGIGFVDVVGSSPFLSLDLGGFSLCLRPIVPAMDAGVIDCDGGSNLGVTTTQDHNLGLAGAACLAAGGSIETQPHPDVCNGPIVTSASATPDSGAGALLIAPGGGTNGLKMELSFQLGSCESAAPEEVFAFTTASYRAEIDDANNLPGTTLVHEELGQNFSCNQFTQENGPGRLVFTLGTLHGAADGSDLILVFVLDD
jgi:hypothetical protein